MKRWAILLGWAGAAALAAACGSKSSGGNDDTNTDAGGETPGASSSGSSSGGSSGGVPVPVDAGSVDFGCMSASDCTSSQLCCGSFGVTAATSACAAGPCPLATAASNGYGEQLCSADTECPVGNSCLPLSGFTNVSVCVDDDAGNTGVPIGQGDGSTPIVEASTTPPAESGVIDAQPDVTQGVEASTEVEASTMDAATAKDSGTGATDATSGVQDATSGATDATSGSDAGEHPPEAGSDAGSPHDASAG
jgi:hypothetical protein